MGKVLRQKFFNRDTETVAQELLGKLLIRKVNGKEVAVMITETEAYDGLEDKASHAHKGKTKRTQVMFGHPGNFYVYLCYGMYYMLNIVTREKNYPAAVLVRGAVANSVNLNGPGKLTKFLKVDGRLNNKKAAIETGLWFEDGEGKIKKENIKKTPRVGVNYAGPVWSARKLRFILSLPCKQSKRRSLK